MVAVVFNNDCRTCTILKSEFVRIHIHTHTCTYKSVHIYVYMHTCIKLYIDVSRLSTTNIRTMLIKMLHSFCYKAIKKLATVKYHFVTNKKAFLKFCLSCNTLPAVLIVECWWSHPALSPVRWERGQHSGYWVTDNTETRLPPCTQIIKVLLC